MKKPNIILFMPETIRADAVLGPGRGRARTPNLDRFCDEGVVFNNAFAQMAFCTPSRCSMFTGLYPHTGGHRSIWHLLQRGERNLFQDLREAGYTNVVFGKNDLLDQASVADCFDEFKPRVPADPASWRHVTTEAAKRLEPAMYRGLRDGKCHDRDWASVESALQFLDEDHDRPWCLFMPLSFAHPHYEVEEPFFSMHGRKDVAQPIPPGDLDAKRSYRRIFHEFAFPAEMSEADCREIKAVFYGMISRVDRQFGQILDKLSEKDLASNTIIAYFSDHGDYAGDYGMVEKCPFGFEDCMLRVPLVFRVPGLEAGKVNSLCEMTDLYATVMDLLGLEPKHAQFGKSLRPLLEGKTDVHRDAVFAEGGRLPDEKHFSIRGLSPKSWYAQRTARSLKDADVTHCRTAMIRTNEFKYTYCTNDVDELFDLRSDPLEIANVASKPEYGDTCRQLRNRLLKWMLETSDTLPLEQQRRGWI